VIFDINPWIPPKIYLSFFSYIKGNEQFPLFYLRGLAKYKFYFLKTYLSLNIILESTCYQQIYANSLMYLLPVNPTFNTDFPWKFKLSTSETK